MSGSVNKVILVGHLGRAKAAALILAEIERLDRAVRSRKSRAINRTSLLLCR